jgi:phosphoglycerol transferase MdoB-like AlkP superfamily enzyme
MRRLKNLPLFKKLKSSIQQQLWLNLFVRFGLILVALLIFRVVFLLKNNIFFTKISFLDYLVGTWFDLITICLYYLPYLVISIMPLPEIMHKVRHWISTLIFSITTFVVYFFSAWDIAYFSYTRKRISYDYFKFMISDNTAEKVAGDFLAEFWWLLLFFVVIYLVTIFIYLATPRISPTANKWRNYVTLAVGVVLFVVIGRGGFQFKPVGVLEATNYTSLENAPAVLNSAFSILKTFNNQGIEKKNYFSKNEVEKIFNPNQRTKELKLLEGKPNVVMIIFESFGSMYVGPENPESFTPFLDSILSKSMYFNYGISNSKTSMDALPAIVLSIPTWMNESFILSSYSMNQFSGLPGILKKEGYSSAFFHGANNGSMRFDAFSNAAGFDRYYGRNEYNNDEHFDGNWGISDHYFMNWSIDKMNEMKPPFVASIFTISSHHPFIVPEGYKEKVKNGPDPICRTLSYVDFAFKEFWEKISKQDWFNNTLFIFVADHVGPTGRSDRTNLEWSYRIPIGFYHPSGNLPKVPENKAFQQIDIMPTVLDLVNSKQPYFAIGTSYFQQKNMPNMVYDQENFIHFSWGRKPFLWNDSKTLVSAKEALLVKKMKAIYQQYSNNLIDNTMLP